MSLKSFYLKNFIYPVLMLICTIPNMVQVFIDYFNGEPSEFWLFTQILFLRISGLLSALAYAGNFVRKSWEKQLGLNISLQPVAVTPDEEKRRKTTVNANEMSVDLSF